jgi:hypothetical protein
MPERRVPRAAELSISDRSIERGLAARIASDIQSAMREYSGLEGASGGKVLNTDLARELSPEYRADRTRSAAVHEPASYLVKQMYSRKLAESPAEGQDAVVLFSAGGTGAGKTTGLEVLAKADSRTARAQIIYDTNMNSFKSAVEKIDQALEAGKEARVVYTWRDPVESLVKGALPRAMRMGRTVPLNEHARTHAGAAKTIKELVEHYKGDARVRFDIIDNSRGKGAARLGDMATIRELDYNGIREDLIAALEAEYAAGRISETVYRGTKGAADSRRPGVRARDDRSAQQGDGEAVTAADRISAASPEVQQAALRTAVAQAVAGRSIEVEPVLSGLPQDVRRLLIEPEDPEFRAATQAGEDALAREIKPTTDAALKAAEEEADLAVADVAEMAKRLGVDIEKDADFAAVMEGVEKAERWARVAELATVCLVRGG